MKKTNLILAVMMLFSISTFAQNGVNVERHDYEIVHAASGFAFDIAGPNRNKGTSLIVWDRHGKWNQQFRLLEAPEGYWYFYNQGSGKVLDVQGGHLRNAQPIQIWETNSSKAQKFRLIPAGDGFVYIEAYNTGLYLSTENPNAEMGNKVVLSSNKGEHSKWLLFPFCNKNITGSQNELIQNLEHVNANLHQVRDQVKELCKKLNESRGAINNVGGLSGSVGGLEDKAENIGNVLATFNAIPTLGTATKALSLLLDRTSDMIGKVRLSLDGINKAAVGPSRTGIEKAYQDAAALRAKLDLIAVKLYEMRKDEENLVKKLEDNGKATQYMNYLNELNKEIGKVNKEIVEIYSINNNVLAVNKPVGDFNKGVKRVDNAVNKADNIAKKVDKVLDKKFKKKIFRKTISVSLKDVLTGGGLASKVRKFTKKWTKKLLNPVLKKLNIKMPSIPGIDKIKNAMNKAKNFVNKMVDKTGGLRSAGDRLTQLQVKYGAAF